MNSTYLDFWKEKAAAAKKARTALIVFREQYTQWYMDGMAVLVQCIELNDTVKNHSVYML